MDHRLHQWLYAGITAALLGGGAGCVSSDRDPASHRFRLMTYNIHHGEGMDGRIDPGRIAEVIRREGADIVALQEVDRGVARSAGRDLPGELAELTGMTCVFSNNFHFQGGEYGNALLTRFPVLDWGNTHYRMLREGEQRGLLAARLTVGGRRLMVLNTHLDFRPDHTERLSNIDEIFDVGSRADADAIIVCGDFNSLPGSPTHAAMASRFLDAWEEAGVGEGFTYSSVEPVRRIDFVFHRGHDGLAPVRAWVASTPASDHLPLVVDYHWPSDRPVGKY